MSRGKWKTTVIKEQVRQAVVAAEAIKIAGIRAERKLHKSKPLLESGREHIGALIDNLKVNPVEVALYGALAYLGYDTFQDWRGALLGPVSLKLATGNSEAGALVGIAGLTALGIFSVLPSIGGAVGEVVANVNDSARARSYILEQTANGARTLEQCISEIARFDPVFGTVACRYAYGQWLGKPQPTGAPGPSKPVPIQ